MLGADISSRDVIEMMMITQYFDMLKDIGMNSTGGAIFLPHSPGNVADVSSEVNPSLTLLSRCTHMEFEDSHAFQQFPAT